MTDSNRDTGFFRAGVVLALAAIVAVAFAIRGLGLQWIFIGDDVMFAPADAMYHARRALFILHNYPSILFFDPYINYPDGAAVAWPPLFDFCLATAAWIFTDTREGFEAVVAWSGPALGALTCVPVYMIGALVFGRGVGLAAASFQALLPISVAYSRVGNADHHAAVAFIGAWLLYACLGVLRREPDSGQGPQEGLQEDLREDLRLGAVLLIARLALLLTWHGSLLYLAVSEVTLLVMATWLNRRRVVEIQAASAAATVLVVGVFVSLAPEPLGGDYSSIALSRLHVLCIGAVAILGGCIAAIERVRPLASPLGRLARTAGFGCAILGVLISLPGPRESLAPAFEFMSMRDGVGRMTGEQFPLFSIFGREVKRAPELSWGYFAYALPLLPFGMAWLARFPRKGSGAMQVFLAVWLGVFGLLAVQQRRYGNDLGPAASVAIVSILAEAGRWVAARTGRGVVVQVGVPVALALAFLWPPLSNIYAKRVRGTWAHLTGSRPPRDVALLSPAGTLTRFAQQVRAATPETSGYLDAAAHPEYGIIAHANMGHALQYVARRATPTDPFWAYIGPENWDRNFAFLDAKSEAEALPIARELNARYVVSTPDRGMDTLVGHLHHRDGRATRHMPRVTRLRLVAEALPGGRLLGDFSSKRPSELLIPYKLYEIVAGATLDVRAEPGAELKLDLELETESGRRFLHSASGVVGEGGRVALRVPYSTDGAAAVRATGPYRVTIGEKLHEVHVPDEAVRQGTVLELLALP